MKTLTMPKFDILKAINSWSVEDRHQLRIFLRRLRILMRLLNKEKIGRQKSGKLKKKLKLVKLGKLSKVFLDSCGEVRDLDVLIDTMRSRGYKNLSLKRKFQIRRAECLNILKQKWTIEKRTNLLKISKYFVDYLESEKPIGKKLVRKKAKQILDILIHSKPGSKKDWHEFRRKLRRVNYLQSLTGETNNNLAKFQKFLGVVHDLENLEKFEKHSLSKNIKKII